MRKMKKFADGGSDKYKARYDRKVADIESDYKKAQARKTGRAAEVAKAKYEQRMADAKDDLAKWTKSDRTQTRAAESAAEKNLSMTRKFGARSSEGLVAKADKPLTPVVSSGDIEKLTASLPKPSISSSQRSAPRRAPARPAPTGGKPPARRDAAKPPEGRGEDIVVTAPRKGGAAPKADAKPKPKQWFRGDTPGQRLGDAVGAPFRAFAKYNPLSLAASAIFDGEPSKPSKPAAPKQRTFTREQQIKLNELRKAAEAPGASRYAQDRYKYAKETGMVGNLKKGGSVKGYAKGGKIDGCAVRGKTKAGRK